MEGDSRLREDGGGSSDDDTKDLRQRLREEASLYKRRLDTYRQAQQNQAALVSRLQAKVLQYKQRCTNLEAQMDQNVPYFDQHTSLTMAYPLSTHTPSSAMEQAQQHLREIKDDTTNDLETALKKLQEERRKSEKLLLQNSSLREQLEDSHHINEALTADLQKLTNDWEELREEMLIKEDEWKDEEQAFNDYYSTEHNRLLNIWRNVVSVKRLFIDIKKNTEQDLKKLKSEVSSASKQMTIACSKVDSNMFTENIFGIGEEEKKQLQQEISKLNDQIAALQVQQNHCHGELQSKDAKIHQLVRDLEDMEDRCADVDESWEQKTKMQEEIDILQNALRHIAHTLIQDAETKETEFFQTSHLSTCTQISQQSPKRSARCMTSPAAFAESTISAVQAALLKYQSLIHELQVKLQSNKEQLLLVRKQLEISEDNVAELEKRSKELITELDVNNSQYSQLVYDRDKIQKSLDAAKAEKNQFEKYKADVNALINSLHQDYDKLQKSNNKIEKELDTIHEEKLFLQMEVDRLNQEADVRELTLRGEQDRCSKIREELLTVREEMNKLYLAHDMLESQKLESENLIENLEKTKVNFEIKLDKILGEQSDVHNSLIKKETIIDKLELDKKKLIEDLKKLESEKLVLQHQCNDLQNDIQSVRKELLQAEQNKLDLESDKVSLSEKCKFLEIDKGKIEIELNQITRERNDLSNQLTVLGRKRDTCNEELMRCRQKLEQVQETNVRVNRNLEELVKEYEEKQCTIDTIDKEFQRIQELLASVRSEKEALEGVLFNTQSNLENTEDKKCQLEKELQELLLKQEQLKIHVARLTKDLEKSEKRCLEVKNSLSLTVGNKEVEFNQVVDKLRLQNEDNIKKLGEEKDKIRISLEKQMQEALQQLGNEKDAEIQKLLGGINNLQTNVDNLSQQHEELMLRAENERQQALLIAHHDQQAVHEKLEDTTKDLQNERDTLERLKREANRRFDQDRVNINLLKDELNKFKIKLEESRNKNEEEKKKLEQRIEEIKIERDSYQAEIENLKVQIHLSEDKGESINNQLHETIRKLKEAENNSEALRKELTDVRRLLADSNFEKEKYHNTNKELRDHVKKIESDKREQVRQLEGTYQKITNLEDTKVALENERNRLQTQIRDLEKEQLKTEHEVQFIQEELQKSQTSNTQRQAEEKDLQARLLNEVEERERAHQEIHQLRKQISVLERNLEHTRQELAKTRSQSGILEEQWHTREQDLLIHLEDSRVREKRLEDQKHNLEVCLVDATQQIQELKAKVGGTEGRVKSLENQLSQAELSKRDIEQKLSSVISTLRRIAGVQLDGSVALPYRLLSPSRRWSPARTHDDKDATIDIDPEVVRKGVKSLMQQVAQIERERDDYKNQVCNARKQLQEAHEHQSKDSNKLSKMLYNMKSLQGEKGSLEAKLGQKNIELQSQAETLNQKNEEVKQLREKIMLLELTLSSGNEEKSQYQDKMDKLKIAFSKLELDKRNLQEELARTENRCTKVELQRMSIEGDLQRLQMILQEKDTAIQKFQEKSENQSRTIASLEERCVSLKSTIDQMTLSLERASQSESEIKLELKNSQCMLIDTTAASENGKERLKQLQKQVTNNENEKRVIAERLEISQQSLAEMRRNNQVLHDQVSRLNNDLANNEIQISGLQSQLRLAQWPTDTSISSHHEEELRTQLQSCQRDRSELKGKVDTLNNKVRQLEAVNRNLEKQVTKMPLSLRSKSYECQEKYETDSTITELDKYEQENRELRMKISRFEAELNDKIIELSQFRNEKPSLDAKFDKAEIERYRAAQLQAERLLEAREQSHRQQVSRLENQVSLLREQLNQEIKRRQLYVLRSTKTGREMQQLRQALGDSLRTVSQDPSLDALLLEHEARKLDDTLSNTASMPPSLTLPSSSYRRSTTPQPK